MSTKHEWDTSQETELIGATSLEWMPEDESRTACKHGRTECERCGTTDRRDVRHTTRNGRGVVASLSDARDPQNRSKRKRCACGGHQGKRGRKPRKRWGR